MNLTVRIPDDLTAQLTAGGDLERRAVEALMAEGYRARRITRRELRTALGLARVELDGFLKEHGIDESMTVEEFDRQQQILDRSGV